MCLCARNVVRIKIKCTQGIYKGEVHERDTAHHDINLCIPSWDLALRIYNYRLFLSFHLKLYIHTNTLYTLYLQVNLKRSMYTFFNIYKQMKTHKNEHKKNYKYTINIKYIYKREKRLSPKKALIAKRCVWSFLDFGNPYSGCKEPLRSM